MVSKNKMKLDKYLKKNRGACLKLAIELDVSPPSVRQWLDKRIPAERVLSIYFATNKKVKPSEMRPDLYPEFLFKIIGDKE